MMIRSLITAGVVATTAITPAMAQVTSVSQLRDVQPTEWSYQAISNLVSRYGCVAGFPDGTFPQIFIKRNHLIMPYLYISP